LAGRCQGCVPGLPIPILARLPALSPGGERAYHRGPRGKDGRATPLAIPLVARGGVNHPGDVEVHAVRMARGGAGSASKDIKSVRFRIAHRRTDTPKSRSDPGTLQGVWHPKGVGAGAWSRGWPGHELAKGMTFFGSVRGVQPSPSLRGELPIAHIPPIPRAQARHVIGIKQPTSDFPARFIQYAQNVETMPPPGLGATPPSPSSVDPRTLTISPSKCSPSHFCPSSAKSL
jgi:hypothetical protein